MIVYRAKHAHTFYDQIRLDTTSIYFFLQGKDAQMCTDLDSLQGEGLKNPEPLY